MIPASVPVLVFAGLLAGFGTRLGSGCTSRHGGFRPGAAFTAFVRRCRHFHADGSRHHLRRPSRAGLGGIMTAMAARAAGLPFGAGLALSGMLDPVRVLGFLDVAGTWDPSLAFVLGGGVTVSAVGTIIARRMRTLGGRPPKASNGLVGDVSGLLILLGGTMIPLPPPAEPSRNTGRVSPP